MIRVDCLFTIDVRRIPGRWPELVFAEGAVGEPVGGTLAADPLVDARPMEPVLAVVDLPQHLARLELIETDAARVSGSTATV